ncbi:MAG: biosynthetic peptidoglycan transglycosylase, partial [Bacillota bacterium]|nr:biosynthetic peptidoglycan transglycosylase [Bacillota bacterium]
MANKRSFLGRFLLMIVIIGLIAAGILFFMGYMDYKEAIEATPLPEKVSEIRSDSSYVTSDEISKDFLTAIVTVEDKRYYHHGALDPIGFGRAIITNLRNKEFSEGGSTITQQVAKNLYFSNEKRLTRKIAEALVAID